MNSLCFGSLLHGGFGVWLLFMVDSCDAADLFVACFGSCWFNLCSRTGVSWGQIVPGGSKMLPAAGACNLKHVELHSIDA